MGQEFIIKSQDLEDKINQLLPSQGGFQAGVDLSASTQIIPIVDLTETAEGSQVRADLQTALEFDKQTVFAQNGSATNIIINTTGYWRVFGACSMTGAGNNSWIIDNGSSQKIIIRWTGGTESSTANFDFVVKLNAGEDLRLATSSSNAQMNGSIRQIADINGNLT
tara:strand:+ start:215 stop:712 length:498 start_codon:yes stop_codon:yes gene_type:complete